MVRAVTTSARLHPASFLDSPTWKSVCSVSPRHLVVPGVQSPPTATPSAPERTRQRSALRATPAPRRGELKVKCYECGYQGAQCSCLDCHCLVKQHMVFCLSKS